MGIIVSKTKNNLLINEKEICFIICYNNEFYLKECILYLQHLNVPDGFTIDIISIAQADSIFEGYEAGMEASNAKYKIYLHQDTFLINPDFLLVTLPIFLNFPKVGMLGVVGNKDLPANGIMWANKCRIGALRSCSLNTVDDYFDIPMKPEHPYETVDAVDGLLIMTQYDLPWRKDLFDGWDFYDISQSFEFRNAGYEVVVPTVSSPLVLHDCGFLNMTNYERARQIFLTNYHWKENTEWN